MEEVRKEDMYFFSSFVYLHFSDRILLVVRPEVMVKPMGRLEKTIVTILNCCAKIMLASYHEKKELFRGFSTTGMFFPVFRIRV